MKRHTEKIKVGSEYIHEFSFTQEDVNGFAKVSGDLNPIHLDEEFAKKSIFKRRIIHGFLGGSIFSKVFAQYFPGEGTIYLKQDLKFLKPMYTENLYKAVFSVLEINSEKSRALVKTEIFDESQKAIIVGEALIQNNLFL